MRYTLRTVAFVLALLSGTSLWYALAYRSVVPVQANIAAALQTSTPEPEPAPAENFMSFGPVEGLYGFTNTNVLILRRKPEASAGVVARLELPEAVQVNILDATRDFVRVTVPAPAGSKYAEEGKAEYEGWASWGAIVPYMSALVLDTASGDVLARVPLGEAHVSVSYSPDGSRALFHATPESGGSIHGFEVNTSDYRITRSLQALSRNLLVPAFYSPVDGSLAAFGRAQDSTQKTLSVMRLSDFYTVGMPTKIKAAKTTLVIAPDGLTGFVIHLPDGEHQAALIDVVDLQSMEIRNSFSLDEAYILGRDSFVVSKDGSEIYVTRRESDSVSVIDTWTGQTLREFSIKMATRDSLYFSQGDLVGDSLLVKYWGRTNDDVTSSDAHVAWLSATRAVNADPGIDRAVEAGGVVYAINAKGTRLFRLDKKRHIQERLQIERPEMRNKKELQDAMTTYGLAASPDGKQIIVFVGVHQGC